MKRIPIEEMKDPMGYDVSLCFEWQNWNSCMTFEIVSDGPIQSKAEIVKDLIDAWGGIVEMENDGTVINLFNFKTAYVTPNENVEKTDKMKKPIMRLVH